MAAGQNKMSAGKITRNLFEIADRLIRLIRR